MRYFANIDLNTYTRAKSDISVFLSWQAINVMLHMTIHKTGFYLNVLLTGKVFAESRGSQFVKHVRKQQ